MPHRLDAATPAVTGLDACLTFTLREEGGYVDDPRDPGGATNMGVTLATLRVWRGNPHLTPADVRALTLAAVTPIYGADYWNKLRCDALPCGLDLMAFDFAVTSGTLRSAQMLQAAVGQTDDGSVGPDTLAAASASNHAAVIAILGARQAAFYRSLPTFHVFGAGWLARTGRRQATALTMAALLSGQPMQQGVA